MADFRHFVITNMLTTFIGYWLAVKKKAVWSWTLCIASVLLMYGVFATHTPLVRMVTLIATAFTGMKVVVKANGSKNMTTLTFRQWMAFVFTWAGMRVEIFNVTRSDSLPGAKRMVTSGLINMSVGFLLIAITRSILDLPLQSVFERILMTTLLLISFSLILHFGLLNISAGVWRYLGVDTYYLFKKPLQSKTLNEFWSIRWNVAFSEMTSIAVFRPLKKNWGERPALLGAFIFSGILHEMAISVPVGAGYGFPMLYFLIQGFAVSAEKVLIQTRSAIFQKVAISKIWTFFWLLAPIPLLLHPLFSGFLF